MSVTVLGHSVPRREDHGLLTGATDFLADLPAPGALHAAFARSPVAHARLTAVRVDEARAVVGVHDVLTAADLALPPLQTRTGEPELSRPLLATDRVRFVGEPVAVVLAESAEAAADALELVDVDYDPLPAVLDPVAAAEPDAPLLFPEHGSNVVLDGGEQEPPAFADNDVVVRARFTVHRVAPVTLEPNGCVALPSEGDGPRLEVWASTQAPFGVRTQIATILGLDEEDVRVRTAAVGGGFGAKGGVYPEQIIVAALSLRTGRAVRWHETRSENLQVMHHGRGQVQDVEIGAGPDGVLTGLRARVLVDAGGYAVRGAFIPLVTRFMANQGYRIPALSIRPMAVVTTTTPTGPYRGAGRPEATVLVERALDVLAAELDMDPVEIRRRNLLASDDFPYDTATGASYDSGDYARALDEALRLADYDALRAEQARRRQNGDRMQLGIGVACYVEVSGRGSEFGSVRVEPDGAVTVVTGSSPHGQGHETVFAQLAASVLGVPMDRIRVVHSDTAVVARGVGTFGSRSLQLAGSAIHQAADAVREQARKLAADLLEANPEDVTVFDDGRIGVVGSPDTGQTWAQLAEAAAERGEDLAAEHDHEQPGTFPFGTHVSVVELDTDTGLVTPLRHVAVDDCGPVVHPAIVEGQVHGGVAQGLAQVFYEEVVFDEHGSPLTGTLVDYLVPGAPDLVAVEAAHTETPSPRNPLGVKGIGESGSTGALSAGWNAAVDALRPFGITHLDPPFTPWRVWRAMQGGSTR